MKETLQNRSVNNKDVFSHEIIDTFFGSNKQQKRTSVVQPISPDKLPLDPRVILKKILKQKHLRWSLFLIGAFVVTSIISYKFSYYSYMAAYLDPEFSLLGFEDKYSLDLLKNDMFNRNVIKKISFKDDASAKSVFLRNSLRLVNTTNTGTSEVSLLLKNNVDFQNKYIELIAKAMDSPRSLYVILKDKDSNIISIPMIISPRWYTYKLNIPYIPDFKYTNVETISFSFGQNDAGNITGSTIYIKKMAIKAKAE
ncbi:MAG: hypothetical protein PHQ52_08145 [Candidatus Omnitrophica bacterium]|nr:hypothetical protein [Candidatus Omnitrophota bacterium]